MPQTKAAQSQPYLLCQNVCLGYEGKTVVSGLSFSVQAGDYLCIVGENGSGKSTLMKAILQLKAPLSGQIVRGGGLLAGEIGYLPQQTQVQRDFPASVQEVVRSGCVNRRGWWPLLRRAEKQLARRNMEKLGIASLTKRCYRELSGGQQQRVLLARALCATEKLLLLDEPTAGLDPKAAADLYALIEALNAEGVGIVMISHDVAAAVAYASHILHIGHHAQLFFGRTKDYLQTEMGPFTTQQGGAPA